MLQFQSRQTGTGRQHTRIHMHRSSQLFASAAAQVLRVRGDDQIGGSYQLTAEPVYLQGPVPPNWPSFASYPTGSCSNVFLVLSVLLTESQPAHRARQ